MNFKWQTDREKALKGMRISAEKKLEGIRLMNELMDKALSLRQKAIRRKLRKIS
ncbi:MAG: hypothetical protein V1662_01560 [Candidatus Omnitrophota bacterium]